MLQQISYREFFEVILKLTIGYYVVIVMMFYPRALFNWLRQRRKKITVLAVIGVSALASVQSLMAQAADGNNGITQANTMIRGYYDTATQLMYAVGAILALIGALRVYQLWGAPHGEAGKAAAGWFGSCVFLVVVSTVYLADGSAKKLYDNLKESGYYAGVISGNVSQSIVVDSITVDQGSYPYYFRCWATQQIVRPTSVVIRSLLTEGWLRNSSRSDNDPHGFLIERWRTLENRDSKVENR